jgi:hypothetical protein
MNSQKVETREECHAELGSASKKVRNIGDPETSSG